MQNLLVTGGAGFIGSNFIHYMLAADENLNVINVDALTYSGSLENLRDLPDPSRHNFIEGNITIGDDCWLGANAIIMPEVNIGEFSIVAANSFVNKSFPSYSNIGENPARLIKTFTSEEIEKI